MGIALSGDRGVDIAEDVIATTDRRSSPSPHTKRCDRRENRSIYSSSIGGCQPTETQALRTFTEIGLLRRNAITVARPQAVRPTI